MKSAEEIRAELKSGYGDPKGGIEKARVHFLGEIAAQLAELVSEVKRLADKSEGK
jgi:hypothetical protein